MPWRQSCEPPDPPETTASNLNHWLSLLPGPFTYLIIGKSFESDLRVSSSFNPIQLMKKLRPGRGITLSAYTVGS